MSSLDAVSNGVGNEQRATKITPLRLLIVTAAIIFGTELSIMMVLFRDQDFLTSLRHAVWDAVVLISVTFPTLYFSSYKPLLAEIARAKGADDEVRRAYEQLEARVRERTLELAQANRQLNDEIRRRQRTEDALREEIRRREAISTLSAMALKGSDISSAIMKEAVSVVADILGAEFCSILELLPDDQHLMMRAGVGWDGEMVGHRFPIVATSPAGYVLRTSEPLVIEDFQTESRCNNRGLLHNRGIVSGICVPIAGKDSLFGLFEVYSTKVAAFTSDDLDFVRTVADTVAEANQRQEAEELFRVLSSNAPIGIYIVQGGRFRYVNPHFVQCSGYSLEELIGNEAMNLVVPEERERAKQEREKMLRGDTSIPYTYAVKAKSGETRWVMESIAPVRYKGKRAAIASFMDITEMKRLEITVRESEERFRSLFEHSPIGIALSHNARLLYVNSAYVRMFGYNDASELNGKSILEVIAPECRELVAGRIDAMNRSNGYGFEGDGIGQRKDGSTFPYYVRTRFIKLSEGLTKVAFVTDITDRKRAIEALNQGLAKLHEILVQTIQAMAKTVEIRDRYTAGHQQRVTWLCLAITEELGLSQERVDAVHFAAMVHDIGKLYIPTEFLVKPGALSEHERSLLRSHPRIGYDILKTIDFPWPVAEIVLQHHERMDGSGYPQGLKGEEILLEARIVAVADVVEAMASFRPYRPALGVDAALNEIRQHSGKLYDPKVVAACLRLFNEKGYTLYENTSV